MITDKLLAFADQKALSSTADSDIVEFPKGGDEIDRTLNLVAQLDDCAGVTPTSATISVTLKAAANGSASTWDTVMTFPAVSVEECIAGKRLVNFAKLPLGMAKYAAFKLAVTVSNGPLTGAKYSAWLTPSVEA